jgi:hypothetical protein
MKNMQENQEPKTRGNDTTSQEERGATHPTATHLDARSLRAPCGASPAARLSSIWFATDQPLQAPADQRAARRRQRHHPAADDPCEAAQAVRGPIRGTDQKTAAQKERRSDHLKRWNKHLATPAKAAVRTPTDRQPDAPCKGVTKCIQEQDSVLFS